MKLILFLIVLGGAAYLFGNYYAFLDDTLRPSLVQINHARENNPQALCNMLSLDTKVTVIDNIPRHKLEAIDMDKAQACQYFHHTAGLMLPNNPPRKNGFIPDILQDVRIQHEDVTKNYGSVTFDINEKRREMREKNTLLAGKTTTRLELRSTWFAGGWNCLFDSAGKPECPPEWSNGLEVTRMELRRDYQIIPE